MYQQPKEHLVFVKWDPLKSKMYFFFNYEELKGKSNRDLYNRDTFRFIYNRDYIQIIFSKVYGYAPCHLNTCSLTRNY